MKPTGRPVIELTVPTPDETEETFLAVAQRVVEEHDKGGSGIVARRTNHPGAIVVAYDDGKVQP